MTPPPGGVRGSVAVYRRIIRLYPREFRQGWGEEAVLLFADLARHRPPGRVALLAFWARQLPDLASGLLAEWWRQIARRHALTYGAAAGALWSLVTAAGNLGWLWSSRTGSVVSWLITAAGLGALALGGLATVAGTGSLRTACRTGLLGGAIAVALTNATGTVVAICWSDRLSHDPVQLADFSRSHEADFQTYQLHELLGGWIYGGLAGPALGVCCAAVLWRHGRRPGTEPDRAGRTAPR
jgi:hypothetical protein